VTDTFIAAFCWQPLAGGVKIVVEVGRMTNRVSNSRAPKYDLWRSGKTLENSGKRFSESPL
jgi:hypothetical protein